jgi:hypothetical protein
LNRSSVDLTARYLVGLTLGFSSRSFQANTIATITNTSGGAIDRVELDHDRGAARRDAARGRRSRRAARRRQGQRPDDPRAARGHPRRRRHGDDPCPLHRDPAAARLAGSNWMFTRTNGIVDAYRWIPWVSRATPFTRPNHGDPFVTPGEPEVTVSVRTDRRLVIASTADRVSQSSDG